MLKTYENPYKCSIVVYKFMSSIYGHTNFFVHVSSDTPHLPFPLHVSSQSQWSAQHAPVGPFPSPFPQYPVIHVGVGLGIDELVTTVVLVVTPLPLHIYESPGTKTHSPTQSPDVLQQDPSGPSLSFLL
jgi:hypothetical protein